MKNVLAVLLVLAISTAVNAEILITVDNVINPQEIVTTPSDTLSIGLWGDGQTPMGAFYLAIISGGKGSLDIDEAIVQYPGYPSYINWFDDRDVSEYFNVNNPLILIALADAYEPTSPLVGQLVDNIIFNSSVLGSANLFLFDDYGIPLDYQNITIAPEPTTLLLFGLGGLILRRKK